MPQFIFTKFAQRKFKKLSFDVQEKIIKKLKFLKTQENINAQLKPLLNFKPATHRLRINSYRLILTQENQDKFVILDLGHRRDVYKV